MITPVGVLLFSEFRVVSEVVQTEVRDLDHEPGVHHAVGGLEVAVTAQVRPVKIGHAL